MQDWQKIEQIKHLVSSYENSYGEINLSQWIKDILYNGEGKQDEVKKVNINEPIYDPTEFSG